jgi:REP element-mobilizing transposase RayT
MALHKVIHSAGIYFITFTCYKSLTLIEQSKAYDLIYTWFNILSGQGHTITGYVIMPNHIHFLLHYNGGHHSLNTIIGNGKRFLAYDIVKRLKEQQQTHLIIKLKSGVKDKDRSRGKIHEVWKKAFDAKECRTDDFCFQKLQYMHNNPCTGRWKLANTIIDYPHSSARFYITRKKGAYPVKDYRLFLKPDEEEYY